MKFKWLLGLSVVEALLVTVASVVGITMDWVYAKEKLYYAAQGIGQDMVTIMIAVPLLLISAVLMRRGKIIFYHLWNGTMLYLAYSYAIYSFAMHFNGLFLVYCGAFGLAVYMLVLSLHRALREDSSAIRCTCTSKAPALFLLVVAGLFYMQWLREIIPALLSGQTPKSIVDAGLMVNAVHVLDIAILLPGMILSAILLWQRKKEGLVLVPMMLGFTVIMALAIIGMMIAMDYHGVSDGVAASGVFLAIAGLSSFYLFRLTR